MIETSIIETHDIDQLAESLTGWTQDYDQVKPGAFEGRLADLWLGDVQVCRETTKCGLVERGSVRDDALYVVIPLHAKGDGWINGETIGVGDVFCGSGGYEWFTKTAEEWDLLIFVVPRHTVEDRLEPTTTKLITQPAGHRIRGAAHMPSLEQLKSTAQVMFDFQGTTVPPEVIEFFNGSLRDNMVNLINQVKTDDTAIPGRVSDMMRTLKRARILIEDEDTPLIQVDDIAHELGVSRRTFRNYCQTITGLPPTTFLRAIRLNNVRRTLKDQHKSVGVLDAAFQSQFTHSGRFSRYYFELFGELPSDTR